MRNILAAAILALPILAPAQALHTGISNLVASVDAPAFAFQINAVAAVAPRVSTGLIAPFLTTALTVKAANHALPVQRVTVEFTVDTAGVPQDVKLVSTVDAETATNVLAAVKAARYTPGKLDGQIVSVPVKLNVDLKN